MSNNGFETLAVFGLPSTGLETDSYLSQISESGFEVVNSESDSDTVSDSTEEQQPGHDDEYVQVESVPSTDVAIITQPGEVHPEPWSLPESTIFTDAVLSNPIFLKSLTADEILNLKHVCKSWATWFNSSDDIIANVRRQDESSDWYFPVLYRLATPAHLFSWTWSGMWHEGAEDSMETQPLPLPSLDCVPRTWRKWSHPQTVAIAGGLLLIRFVRDIVNVPVRTYRCVREYWEPKGFKLRYCNYCWGDSSTRMPGCHRCITRDNRNWEPLMVVNPLTKAVRFLPAPDCFKLADWDVMFYDHMEVLMRVNDEANSYEVILLYISFVFVYSSTSDSWKCLEFHQAGPWRSNGYNWGYNCASAWVGRRLFLADIRFPYDADYLKDPLTAGVLQVFEIDVEAGDWRLYNDFPLSKFTNSIQIPFIDVTGIHRDEEADDLIYLQNLELVECMGHIYAVIPARLDEYLHPLKDDTDGRPIRWSNRSNYAPLDPKYMPLQFYILQLTGDSLVHGVLRIELEPSATEWDYKSRRQNLFDKTKPENDPSQWFSCVGKGSVIWVSIEDYLLQYDVVSGQTGTQVIPVNWVEENMRFAYRPSFHMKP